jgi:antitoxin (DNA-binding transcriptional repressor) of toxin-antitoxin stability system
MSQVRSPRRALIRWYTVAVAVVCGVAVTVIVHDGPASRVAAQRQSQAAAWKAELAATRARVATADAAGRRLRGSYNRLVQANRRREQRLLAAVDRWRRIAAQR